jgi:thioredoxin reductase (NADPH)
MIETDILIIGRPNRSICSFEAGLLKLKCHILDALPQRVGSCQNFILKANLRYPGFPEVLAGDLVDNLMEQIKQFEPGFTLENVLKRLKNKKTAVLL